MKTFDSKALPIEGGNGSNDHVKLKPENGFSKRNQNLEKADLEITFTSNMRIQVLGPRFPETDFPVRLVPTHAQQI